MSFGGSRGARPRDAATKERLLALRERVQKKFNAGDWSELGFLTDSSDIINGHHRLLRSLDWGDEDYSGNILDVLVEMNARDPRLISQVLEYMDKKYPSEDAVFISAKPAQRVITFAPHVFQVPEGYVESDLVAVMMPFAKEFDDVFTAIKQACEANRLRCLRADSIWEESVLMQDIFNLIYRAQVVIVDFSQKNANVMYETGIAHTLGKEVIPITQSHDDVPFDTKHHRTPKYLPNAEGLVALRMLLKEKLKQYAIPEPKKPTVDLSSYLTKAAVVDLSPKPEDDDIPF
jgi:AbiJ N-terminal domain 5